MKLCNCWPTKMYLVSLSQLCARPVMTWFGPELTWPGAMTNRSWPAPKQKDECY